MGADGPGGTAKGSLIAIGAGGGGVRAASAVRRPVRPAARTKARTQRRHPSPPPSGAVIGGASSMLRSSDAATRSGTTLLREGACGRGASNGDARGGSGLRVGAAGAAGRWGWGARGGLDPRPSVGGGETSEGRFPCAASRTIAASSGMLRTGRHSSRPSCQQSESSVTAPERGLPAELGDPYGPDGDAVDRDVPFVGDAQLERRAALLSERGPTAVRPARCAGTHLRARSTPATCGWPMGARGFAAERLVARLLFATGRGASEPPAA